jgi:hypothetical protein
MSLGFSMAAITRAAKTIFSQVLPMLRMWMPERHTDLRTKAQITSRGARKRTVSAALPDVVEHLLVNILGTNMALGSKEELDILLSCAKDRREF